MIQELNSGNICLWYETLNKSRIVVDYKIIKSLINWNFGLYRKMNIEF